MSRPSCVVPGPWTFQSSGIHIAVAQSESESSKKIWLAFPFVVVFGLFLVGLFGLFLAAAGLFLGLSSSESESKKMWCGLTARAFVVVVFVVGVVPM